MYAKAYFRLGFLSFALVASSGILLTPHSAYALRCPDGSESHAAAAGEVDGVEAGTQTCAQGKNILNGGCDSNPYPYLEARHSGDKSNSFVTPQGTGGTLTNGMNPSLACRLKKFMEFAETKGCPLRINSAMRPVQKCNPSGGACAPQGKSCHQYGLAVDVGGSESCLAWVLQTLGRQNPNAPFGLHSAYAEHAGYRHLQCVENLVASCSLQTKGCDGKVNINPDTSGIPDPSPTAPKLSDQIRQALGMQQQPPSSPPPPPPQQQQPQSLPQSSQPQITQTPVSDLISTSATPTSASINIATDSPRVSATSTFDLIDDYANPVSDAIDVGVATSVALNDNIDDATSLEAKPPRSVYASGTVALNQGYPAQQTFTSGDLANNPVWGVTPERNGFLARLLLSLRDVLLYALNTLRPFGRNTVTPSLLE